MNINRFFTTKNIAKIAILSTIAFVLMIFAFPLPFIPKFYSLDLPITFIYDYCLQLKLSIKSYLFGDI